MIELAGKTVCFTGKFSNGMKRDALFEYAEALGAKPINHVTKTLGALVVGGKGNKQWINPDKCGKKILKVRELNSGKDDEDKILIIKEDQFMAIATNLKPQSADIVNPIESNPYNATSNQ